MIFDKYEEIEIEGKKHRISYPNEYGWEMEAHLLHESLYETVQAFGSGNLRNRDMYFILKYGLLGGDPAMTEETADSLTRKMIQKGPEIVAAVSVCIKALGKCGCIALQDEKKPEAAKQA